MDNLQKSLTELIDETLAEIEALKKSERYSAHEIDLADEKANGSMDAKAVAKAEEDDEEKEDEGKEESEEAKKSDDEDEDDEGEEDEEADMKKAEEACAKALKKYEMCKAEAEHKKKMLAMKKGEWDKKDEDKKEDDKEEEKDLKKSIDARVAPIESKLSEVLSAVKRLSETPVPARGASYRDVKPLAKSIEVEPLTKSQVLNEMVSLKKSGKEVLSEDVIQVEDGSADHLTMARKYGIKA